MPSGSATKTSSTPGLDRVGASSVPPHRNHHGLTHLAFNVDDVDAAATRLVRCGGTLLAPTRSNPGVELVFVADPDGTRVELMGAPG